jgi:hypothetical protein
MAIAFARKHYDEDRRTFEPLQPVSQPTFRLRASGMQIKLATTYWSILKPQASKPAETSAYIFTSLHGTKFRKTSFFPSAL